MEKINTSFNTASSGSSEGSRRVGELSNKVSGSVSRLLGAAGIGVLAMVGLSISPMLTAIAGGVYIGSRYYNRK